MGDWNVWICQGDFVGHPLWPSAVCLGHLPLPWDNIFKQFRSAPVTYGLTHCLYSLIRPSSWAYPNPGDTGPIIHHSYRFHNPGSVWRFSLISSYIKIRAETHTVASEPKGWNNWVWGLSEWELKGALDLGSCEILYESKWNKYVYIYCDKTFIDGHTILQGYFSPCLFLRMSRFQEMKGLVTHP